MIAITSATIGNMMISQPTGERDPIGGKVLQARSRFK